MSEKFKALVVREREDNTFARAIEERSIDELPEGELVATLAPIIGNLLLSPWQLDRYDRIMAA